MFNKSKIFFFCIVLAMALPIFAQSYDLPLVIVNTQNRQALQKGADKILKKVGEESTEVIIAGKGGDRAETVYEIADLAYHVMVLMVEMGIRPEEIRHELASRHIIDHKVKQEKMV